VAIAQIAARLWTGIVHAGVARDPRGFRKEPTLKLTPCDELRLRDLAPLSLISARHIANEQIDARALPWARSRLRAQLRAGLARPDVGELFQHTEEIWHRSPKNIRLNRPSFPDELVVLTKHSVWIGIWVAAKICIELTRLSEAGCDLNHKRPTPDGDRKTLRYRAADDSLPPPAAKNLQLMTEGDVL
jgi:hypothetical protein